MTTRAIKVTLTEFSNAPIAGATVMIQLVGLGLSDGGSVAPSQHTAVTDASGICVFNLWPNTEGFEFTHYEIYSTHPITHRLIHNYEPFMVGLVNADVEDLIASFGRDRIAYLRNKISGGTSTPPATTGPHTHDYTEVTAVPSARLLGRYSADAGAAQAITLGDNLTLSPSGVLSAAGGGGSLVKWTAASADQRLALTGLTTDDLHKVCFQSDIVAYFMLSSLSPITWVELNHSSVIDVTQAPIFATGSTEDNQIDERSKIQSAIDYSLNFTPPRKVLIPSGKKFFIDSPVFIPSKAHLVVDGELLLRNTASTPPPCVVGGPYLSGPTDTTRLNDAVLEGSGKIGLSLAASQDPVYMAAEIQPFRFVADKNVTIKDFTIYRMNFLGEVRADNGASGSHFQKRWCDQVYIENLKLKDPIGDTGRLLVSQLNSGRIKDNVFVDNNLPVPMYTGAIKVTSYDQFTLNGLPGSSSITEYVNEMPENWAAHGRIEVSGNVVMSYSLPYNGGSLEVFCNNADVFNNTTYGIISWAGSACERNTTRVHNNFCRGDIPIEFEDLAEYGISVVENNTIEHCTVYGLKITGQYKFPVTRNNFVLHMLSGEAAQVLNVQQASGFPSQIKHGQIYDNFFEKEGHANVYGGNSPALFNKAKIEMPKWAGSTT